MSLVSGIILTVIGVILYAISSMIPPGASTIARIGGIILAIIGIVVIILAALGVGLYLDMFGYQNLINL